MLTGTRRFSEHYGLKDKKQFEDYLQGQLDKIVLPNKDEAFLRTKILEMYTNPLKNFLLIRNKVKRVSSRSFRPGFHIV